MATHWMQTLHLVVRSQEGMALDEDAFPDALEVVADWLPVVVLALAFVAPAPAPPAPTTLPKRSLVEGAPQENVTDAVAKRESQVLPMLRSCRDEA